MVKLWTRAEYHQVLGDRNLLWVEECPFCDHEAQKKDEMIIWEGKHWFIVYNKYPYTGNDQHIMAVPRVHREFFIDFSSEEVSELSDIHRQVRQYFGDGQYFSFCRETHGTNTKSIKHYHIQFIGAELYGKYLRKMLQNQGFPIEQELNVEKKLGG